MEAQQALDLYKYVQTTRTRHRGGSLDQIFQPLVGPAQHYRFEIPSMMLRPASNTARTVCVHSFTTTRPIVTGSISDGRVPGRLSTAVEGLMPCVVEAVGAMVE